ncbi:hypothetical protein ACFWIA_02720 [Streptomyces sp. NPDC127068]|uniref:hypothetical protein n=1 Tax=Streptomyces sp. NPDC127068 TaxID=3347127 RepID=UPI003668B4AB
MAQEHGSGPDDAERRSDEAVLLVAGAVDLVLERAEDALRRVRSLLGRSDLGELTADVRRDLLARGRNSGLDPVRTASAPAHLELLAHRARERTGPDGAGAAARESAPTDAASRAPGHPTR